MTEAAGTVYRGLTRAELDREYSPSTLVESLDAELAEWAERSARARRQLTVHRDIPYGPDPEEVLDFFPADPGAPLLVYIHGGYWCALSKDESSFLAPDFVARGAAFAALSYPLAPRATLDEIVASCTRALHRLRDRAPEFGVDTGRVYLCGMSAGAHLAAMLAVGAEADLISGVIAMSGIYDLEPITLSYVNEPLGLDAAAAHRNSPLHHLRAGLPPLIAAYGDNETAEFKRQSKEFSAAWARAGNHSVELEITGRHHFDLVYACGDSDTALGAATLNRMRLPLEIA